MGKRHPLSNSDLEVILDIQHTKDYQEYKHDIARILLMPNGIYIADYRHSGLRPITNELASKTIKAYSVDNKYKQTYSQWRRFVTSELKRMGFVDTKEAFFWYLHDYTDLLGKVNLRGGFAAINKHKFMQYSWKDLYRLLY